VKCITAPFPDARESWFRAANTRRVMVKGTDAPPSAMLFRWNKGELKHGSASFHESGMSLRTWLALLAKLSPEETEGDGVLLGTDVRADFVVREGASAEKVVAALEKIARKEFRLPVKMAFQEVYRNVYVASGEYRFTPVKDRPRDHFEFYARDVGDPKVGGGGSGDFAELLKAAGEFTRKRVVAGEVKGAPKGRLSWHHNTPDGPFTADQWEAAHDPEGVLKHLAEQTGLTIKEESRKVRVLLVERKE
jgi:hypothetical protein